MTEVVLEVGAELPQLSKTIYQRALAEAAFAADSIHNDSYTRGSGYPGALVSAYVLNGYMSEPLVRMFGASWFATGRLALTFIGKGVQQGDQVMIGGQVTEIEPCQGGSRISLEIWMDKVDGARPVVGRASAVLAT